MSKRKRGKCKIWWCDRLHYARGYCVTHYRALVRFGSPYGKNKKRFDYVDDIMSELLLLLKEINYSPGPTKDAVLFGHAQKIKQKLRKEDNDGDKLIRQ